MPAQGKHRDAIIDAAVALFRRRGYAGTGLNDIVEMSGAPKGSLYHYFPDGKASIAEAAVRRAGENGARTMQTLAETHKGAGALVRGYARLVAGWMAKSRFADGSPITTTLLEMAPSDAKVTAAGRHAFAALRQTIASRLTEEGVPAVRAAALASLAIAAIEGSLIQARVERSADPISAIARELEQVLDAAVSEHAKGRKARGP